VLETTLTNPLNSPISGDSLVHQCTSKLPQTFSCYPHPPPSWCLLAAPGALTRDHVDAAGYGTYIKVLAGKGKLVLICLGPKDSQHLIFDNTRPWIDDIWAAHSSEGLFMVDHFHWQSVFVPEGGTL
jgi:hypothetical protein